MNIKPIRLALILIFATSILNGLLYADGRLDEGIRYLKHGEYEKAREFFGAKVRENQNDAEANCYLGRSCLMSGEPDKAVDYCGKAVKLDNQTAEYHFWLGQTLAVKAQNSNFIKQALIAPKILKEFERTIELDSTHVGGHAGAGNYYVQAPSVIGGGMEKARKEAEILMRLNEKQGRLLFIQIHEKENKPDLAGQEYEKFDKSFNDSTDNYQFYNSYGYFLLKLKKYGEAVEMFKKQVQLASDKANPHDSLGDGLAAAGRLEEALAEYRKALELDPRFKASAKKIKELTKQLRKEK
jgi:tetratricopeptide (TPR) repeat protein